MAKLTYANKTALNENPSIAAQNKITDNDMNEIKEVVNENDDNVGNLATLKTSTKSSVVGSINELVDSEVYSSTETKTNKVWIDGKPIYRKVFTYSNVAITNNTSLEAIITSDPTKIDIVKMEGIFKHATGTNRETRPFPTIASDGKPLQIRWSNNYIKFSGTDTWSSGSDRDIYVIIEYTKSTD